MKTLFAQTIYFAQRLDEWSKICSEKFKWILKRFEIHIALLLIGFCTSLGLLSVFYTNSGTPWIVIDLLLFIFYWLLTCAIIYSVETNQVLALVQEKPVLVPSKPILIGSKKKGFTVAKKKKLAEFIKGNNLLSISPQKSGHSLDKVLNDIIDLNYDYLPNDSIIIEKEFTIVSILFGYLIKVGVLKKTEVISLFDSGKFKAFDSSPGKKEISGKRFNTYYSNFFGIHEETKKTSLVKRNRHPKNLKIEKLIESLWPSSLKKIRTY